MCSLLICYILSFLFSLFFYFFFVCVCVCFCPLSTVTSIITSDSFILGKRMSPSLLSLERVKKHNNDDEMITFSKWNHLTKDAINGEDV